MEYSLLFLLIFAFALIFLYWRKIRFKLFYRLITQALVKKQQNKVEEVYCSGDLLKKIIKTLFKGHNQQAKRALLCLCCARTEPAEKYCQEKNLPLWAASLRAYSDISNATSQLEELYQHGADKDELISELAELYYRQGRKNRAEELFNNLPDKTISKYVKAKKYYYLAQFYLNDGNMLDASEYAAKAAKLFQKSDSSVEEAYAYLLMGTIYRVSAIEDVAHFMFEQAQKLFIATKNNAGLADAWGNLGMLWVMREKFAEADDYFDKSLKLNQKMKRINGEGYILCQMALSLLLQKQNDKAKKNINNALKIMKKAKNNNGMAAAYMIMSYIYSALGNWADMLKKAKNAEKIYQKQEDTAAYLESLYLAAWADFELDNLENAEKTLRQITDLCQKKESCFHAGNAYNLLGLIFLKQKDWKRAKGIFLQSATLEQKNERFSAAATDYLNIAIIESKLGNDAQALKTLETALEYASAFEETELSEILKDKIIKLRNKLK